MKNFLILTSILIIAFIAFFDAKERLAELDSVAANTPSQVEMKQMINNPDEQMKRHVPNFKNNVEQKSETIQDKMNNGREDSQNQLDNVERRRNTINNKME